MSCSEYSYFSARQLYSYAFFRIDGIFEASPIRCNTGCSCIGHLNLSSFLGTRLIGGEEGGGGEVSLIVTCL